MTGVPPGLNWIQWCIWISGPPLVPTEEFVFPLVEASGGRLVPAPREGVAVGVGPRWGLIDEYERLCVLIGDERTEVREIFMSGASRQGGEGESLQAALEVTQPLATELVNFLNTLNTIEVQAIALVCGIWTEKVQLSSILAQPLLLDGAERAEIATCRTLSSPFSNLTWNRWLRIRKGPSVDLVEGLWLEVDVNTLEHPLPQLEDREWPQCLADGVSLLIEGLRQLELLKSPA